MALDPLALLRMAVMRFPFVQSLSKDFNGNRVYSMYAVAVQRNHDSSVLHSTTTSDNSYKSIASKAKRPDE